MRARHVPFFASILFALVLALPLVACAGDDDGTPSNGGATSPTGTPATGAPATGTPDGEGNGAAPDGEGRTITVITHDSFDLSDEQVEAFESRYNVRLQLIRGGDANVVVNRAILNAGNPEADVLFGVDNLSFERAAEAGVFEPYVAERRGDVPADILAEFGDANLVTPIDYGYVNINYDPAGGNGAEPPATFEELLGEQWRGALAVQDPTTSSPGLQFLASTIAHFGEDGWQDYWRALRANDVVITDGWSEAYYTHFSHYGGDRPLVVSYTTSPAAEVYFSEGAHEEPPTVNVIPGRLFRQVEAAGILAGSQNADIAGWFIDFMLTDEFQRAIPETFFVYPVIEGLEMPDWWRFAEVEVEPAELRADAATIEGWLREWTEIMRR